MVARLLQDLEQGQRSFGVAPAGKHLSLGHPESRFHGIDGKTFGETRFSVSGPPREQMG